MVKQKVARGTALAIFMDLRGKQIPDTNFVFIGDAGGSYVSVYCLCDPGKALRVYRHNITKGLSTSCGCMVQQQAENGDWGSKPECFVMNYLSDLEIPYKHDGRYDHGTHHRWDFAPIRKTEEGRRFLIEVTEAPVRGLEGGPKYWTTLWEKVRRARRNGDVVIILKFYGKDREEVLDSVLFPALVKHGVIS